MTEDIRVVAHFVDGKLLKGTTRDFQPNRPSFHLRPPDGGEPYEVISTGLKALFFVRDLKGKPQRRNVRGFLSAPGATTHGKKVVVRFADGEILYGYSHTYSEQADGFFVFPADTSSNNLRIYVFLAATTAVKLGPDADSFARAVLRKRIA